MFEHFISGLGEKPSARFACKTFPTRSAASSCSYTQHLRSSSSWSHLQTVLKKGPLVVEKLVNHENELPKALLNYKEYCSKTCFIWVRFTNPTKCVKTVLASTKFKL